MAAPQDFKRDANGIRFQPGGIDTVHPLDSLAPGKYAYLQNVRAYKQLQIVGRSTESAPLASFGTQSINISPSLTPVDPAGNSWINLGNATNFASLFASQGIAAGATASLQLDLGPQNVPTGATIVGIGISGNAYASIAGVTIQGLVDLSGYVTSPASIALGTSPSLCSFGGSIYLGGITVTPAQVNAGISCSFAFHNTTGSAATVFLNSALVLIFYTTAGIPHSLRLLNDTTPNGPAGGYVRVIGAGGAMYVNSTQVATGESGNPMAFCPFRPNASVRPWMYTGDPSQTVTISTHYLLTGAPVSFPCTGMTKVNSEALIFKTGIKEPQIEPTISTSDYTTTGTDALPATTIPWTNVGGANADYNYGLTNPATGTPPIVITGGGPTLVFGASVTVAVTGTATVNGAAGVGPGTAGPTDSATPGAFITSPAIVVGAFTDISGNVVPPTTGETLVFSVGAGTTLTVPANAAQLQIGIDSSSNPASANYFNNNSGSFTINWSVTVRAIASVVSTIGDVTAYVWGTPPPAGGGSPHSGPVAAYIWKNPNDSGSGTPRSITDPVPDSSPSNNSWMFCSDASGNVDPTNDIPSVPVNWNVLATDGTVESTITLFDPALESEGYQDFNCCVVGSLFVPAAGTYTLTVHYKDQIMLGIGGGASVSTGNVRGTFGQTQTVVNALPLLYVGTINGGGGSQTATIAVTFPATGTYEMEIDWDYWFHTGRSLIVLCNGAIIPPLSSGVRTNVQYRYVYRSSATGALSNPSPESAEQSTPVLANTVSSVYSNDPQIDKVDYYRMDAGLDNFTYVATGPNDGLGGTINGVLYNTPIEDELSDTAAVANPILQFDNFEPFPVVDLPHSGRVNISGGVATWVSGDQFNTRWLPGTDVLIGSPTSLAYTTIARPSSTTSLILDNVPDGTNVVYEIPEPLLAAQPLAYLWGPTDNTAYMFGVGDPLNPGTLYFTKGNNPDSAPDTNQIAVTSPSEPLMNGCITAGLGMVFSTERRWLIYPTFTTALATVSGVAGSVFNLVLASSDRGLYIATCLTTDGGNRAFFRAKDGLYWCAFGGGDQFLCADIYNLFPREGVTPVPITIAGNTIYPPDDTRPEAQKLAYANGYLYYDYQDSTGTPRTLVFGEFENGWSVDVGQFAFTVHALEEGPETNTVMVGCADGTVRVLGSGNAEVTTSIVIPGCQNSGDARAFKRIGDVYIKALVTSSNPIIVGVYANRYSQTLSGFSPTSLIFVTPGVGSLAPYIVDFSDGFGSDVIDVGISLTWPTAAGNLLDLWQPDWINLPESTQDRPTDWDDGGFGGNKFVQGMMLEADTFGALKAISVRRSDDLTLLVPNESPIAFNGQSIKPLTFTPPFIAHSMQIISTDGLPWRRWGVKWVYEPYPESTIEWQSEFTSHGMMGWQHIREMNIAYLSTTALTLTLTFDQWPTIVLPIPTSSGAQFKYKTPIPANKWKLIAYRLSSTAPFYLFRSQCEAKVKPWGSTGPYSIITPFGGPDQLGADV